MYYFTPKRLVCVYFMSSTDHARILSKQMLRGPTLEKLQTKRDEDVAFFTNFIQKEYIQKSLGMYLESLKKRQK